MTLPLGSANDPRSDNGEQIGCRFARHEEVGVGVDAAETARLTGNASWRILARVTTLDPTSVNARISALEIVSSDDGVLSMPVIDDNSRSCKNTRSA